MKHFREMRKWSQEQLGDISGVSVRTIQRVETGKPSSLDTRRALARTFEIEDIDAFNKPYAIPTDEEIKAVKEQFDKENITLPALPVTTGKELAVLMSTASIDMFSSAFELTREADERFAALTDYCRDYRDCTDLYSEVDKFPLYDEIQSQIEELKALGVSLRHALRKVLLKGGSDGKPIPSMLLYIVAFPSGKAPDEFAAPREVSFEL